MRQLAILCTVLLTESICTTVLIPFVGYYVSFMTNEPVEAAGYSARTLVSAFMAAQILSSKFWGVISEKCGRKVGIACGVLGCAGAVCMFGLSTSVYACAVWRFVHSLFAGCSLIAKTMISDVTDRTNQAKGSALVSLTWCVGTLIGPAVGGWFYNPTQQAWMTWLHLSEDGFLARHPAFMPSFIACLYNLFALAVCILLLEETNMNAGPIHMFLPDGLGRVLRPVLRFVQPRLPAFDIGADPSMHRITEVVTAVDEQQAVKASEAAAVIDEHGTNTKRDSGPWADAHEDMPTAAPDGQPQAKDGKGDVCSALVGPTATTPQASFGFKQAFRDPNIRTVIFMSMLISASGMLYAEIFPLWAVATRERGGLALETALVGNLILVNSIPAVIGSIFFSRVVGCFKSEIFFWNLCQLAYATVTLFIPFSAIIRSDSAALWFTMGINLTRKVAECWTFAMLMLVVAQTAPSGWVAIMYGVQQATACFVRCLVPVTCAPLLASSIAKDRPFPLNHRLLYTIYCGPLRVSVAISSGVRIRHEVPAPAHMGDHEECGGSQSEPMSHESIHHASFATNMSFSSSRHTFIGSTREGCQPVPMLFKSSCATLANSFATNIVPGGSAGINHSTASGDVLHALRQGRSWRDRW